MSACTFFGHRDCCELDADVLKGAIEALIRNGVDTFYVGNQGQFDAMVFRALLALKKTYPHISVSVVLAYLPVKKEETEPYQDYSIYPEGLETGPKRFAIQRRNLWMIESAAGGYCLCYIHHTWGGACKFARRAKSRGLVLVNLGTAKL